MDSKLFSLKQQADELIGNALAEKVFPGAVIGISGNVSGMRERLVLSYGYAGIVPKKIKMHTNVFFDLASLTKPLATTLAVLCLLKDKKLSLDENLSSLLEQEIEQEKKKITLQHILCHCSGFPAHRPYYTDLLDIPPKKRKDVLMSWLLQEPLLFSPGLNVLYSDLGFMLLGRIIEVKAKEKLEDFVKKKVLKPLGLERGIFFRSFSEGSNDTKNGDTIFAATEDCSWRRKVICGQVHDDNAYALGGVAGHAGLFGDIEHVLSLAVSILDQWQGRAVYPNYLNDDLKIILSKQKLVKESSWALGFDTPAKTGSSGGKYLSEKSVGHLGYTGTSFWIDPTKDLVVVLLTNRIHPNRDNDKIKKFRPVFHDAMIKEYILLQQERCEKKD